MFFGTYLNKINIISQEGNSGGRNKNKQFWSNIHINI